MRGDSPLGRRGYTKALLCVVIAFARLKSAFKFLTALHNTDHPDPLLYYQSSKRSFMTRQLCGLKEEEKPKQYLRGLKHEHKSLSASHKDSTHVY